MTKETRRRAGRLLFILEERALRSNAQCACRRPAPEFMTPDLRKAMDEFAAAVAEEPETTRFGLLEIDKE